MVQLTLEQHRFELHGSTYMRISFNKYRLQYYTIYGWLNPQIENRGYRGPIVLIYRFLTAQGVGPLNPHVVEGSTVIAQGRLSRQKVQYHQKPGGLNQEL